MKSILQNLRLKKTTILTVLEGQDFDVGKNLGFKRCKISKKSKLNADKIVKKAVFENSKLPKLISRKI